MFERWRGVLLASVVLAVSSATGAAVLDSASVHAAAQYSANHEGLTLLVSQNGRVLLERYSGGANAEMALRIYSGTKAFWDLAALAASEDALLDLDEPVAKTIPQWRDDARKARVTLRQLLDFDCGLDPKFSLQELQSGDRDTIAVQAPLVAEPGSAFIYGPAALQVFHRVLRAKLRGESPTHYLERRVLRCLGLNSQRYVEDGAGNPLLAAGFVLSARQWAKIGELVLRDGAPVVTKSTLAQCWRGSTANPMFSLGWWNNRAAPAGREIDVEAMLARKWQDENWRGGCLCRDAPADLVACIGSGRQRLYVIPSLRLVVVRQGDGGSFSDQIFLRLLLHGNRA